MAFVFSHYLYKLHNEILTNEMLISGNGAKIQQRRHKISMSAELGEIWPMSAGDWQTLSSASFGGFPNKEKEALGVPHLSPASTPSSKGSHTYLLHQHPPAKASHSHLQKCGLY